MSQPLTLANVSETTGPVYWIDHFVLNSADVGRWAEFSTKLLGAQVKPSVRGVFQMVGPALIGAFEPSKPLPPAGPIGRGLPRYGYYINRADIRAHLTRLDALGVVHSGPVYTAAEGEAGTAIYWQDPDGNNFEFWAPDAPPPGAMAAASSEGVGRISHAVFEAREFDRVADFFTRYCEAERLRDPSVADDTLVLRLASGSRIVYKNVDELGARTIAKSSADGVHTALTVHHASFFPNYRRLWATLPEWGEDAMACKPDEVRDALPARSNRHASPEGRQFYALVGRGDGFYDWDCNQFHFISGVPENGSMTDYEANTIGAVMAAWKREHATLDGFRSMVLGE